MQIFVLNQYLILNVWTGKFERKLEDNMPGYIYHCVVKMEMSILVVDFSFFVECEMRFFRCVLKLLYKILFYFHCVVKILCYEDRRYFKLFSYFKVYKLKYGEYDH